MNGLWRVSSLSETPARRAASETGEYVDERSLVRDERQEQHRDQIGSGVRIQRLIYFACRRLVVNFERDPTSVRERCCECASTPTAQRTPEVVDNGVSNRTTELQGLLAAGSAGGIEMTTRGVPSARATIALPVATA